MASRKWSKKQRKRQAESIHRWKPWDKSTGPRTPEGKAKSSQNALRHGVRSKVVKHFRRVVKENRRFGLFDFAEQENIETARDAAIDFVNGLARKEDVDALVTGQEFVAIQTRKAIRNIRRVHDRLVQADRFFTYSLRSPRIK